MRNASKKYARALAMSAKGTEALRQLSLDFEQFTDAMKRSKDFRAMFFAPQFSAEQKVSIYRKMFSPLLSPGFVKFLGLIHRNKRERCLFDARTEFEALCRAAKNEEKAVVTTASPLKQLQLSRLSEVLSKKTGKKIIIENIVDPSIISGAKIGIRDRIIDVSTAAKLTALRRELSRC